VIQRSSLALAAIGLGLALPMSASAVVVGSSNLNQVFVPSEQLHGRSATFFLPGIPELQFSTITTALDGGQPSYINGNFMPIWGIREGSFVPLSHIDFTTYESNARWGLPDSVGPGGWEPSSGLETNTAAWDLGLLAFSFDRDDGRHYGWVEFTSAWYDSTTTFELYRYGYETEAGRAILFGDTGHTVPVPSTLTLAAIALVAASVRTRRRGR
jgi:hypothetical protein